VPKRDEDAYMDWPRMGMSSEATVEATACISWTIVAQCFAWMRKVWPMAMTDLFAMKWLT